MCENNLKSDSYKAGYEDRINTSKQLYTKLSRYDMVDRYEYKRGWTQAILDLESSFIKEIEEGFILSEN